MTTDSEIIGASLDDPPAFAAIFDRHAASLHRFCARRTNPTVADDVVSQTFLVAFERRGSFDLTRADAVPWLYGIATRLLHRHRRDEVRMLRALARSADDSLAAEHAPDVDDRVDAERAVADIAHALRALPSTQRDALLLWAWADLSYDQIAEATAVPIGTVRSRISRARSALRALDPELTTTTSPRRI